MTVEIQASSGNSTIQLQTTGTTVAVTQPATTTVTVQAAGISGPQGTPGATGPSGSNDWNSLTNKPSGLVSSSAQIDGSLIASGSIAIGNTSISLGNTPTFPFFINNVTLIDSTATGSFSGSFKGDGSQLTNLPATFPYSGTAAVTGSLNITGSATLNSYGLVSSNTVTLIQTLTSASYAALTPVSGTLYIVIG